MPEKAPNDRLFSLRLPSDHLDALERIAEEEDRTIADIVRRAIRHEIAMKHIGHEPECAVVVGKPCDCGGVWRAR